MKSGLYVVNTTATTVATNGIIPFNTIVRRRNNTVNLNGNTVTITDCNSNYYLVTVSVTFTSATADTATLQLYYNGNAYTGATASTTVATATTEVKTLVTTAIVRSSCCNDADTITVVNTGTPTLTTSNVSMTVTSI